mgnify:FL=1
MHGLAGDAAAEALGELALTANDVIERLPGVWKRLQRESTPGFTA